MIETGTFIFVHVPKNGGASIEQAICFPLKNGPLHAPLRSVRKGKRKAFGFVRNPWDRLVSAYSYYCQREMPPHRIEQQALARKHGFKWWLTEWQPTPKDQAVSFRSQMWWLDGCDRIGMFEYLKRDFEIICAEFGIKANKLPHINASKHEHYSTFYDSETIAIVGSLYAPEIERFEYEP